MNEFPMILAFVKDLNSSIRIESAAEMQGYELKLIETAIQISPEDDEQPGRTLGEPLQGREGVLLEKITQWRPSLMIFDLGNDSVPWLKWITLLTSVPATRGMPVLCYGPHVDIEQMKAAKAAGATKVVARSKFFNNLPDLLLKHARVIDLDQLQTTCEEPLSHFGLKGLEMFNRGKYFEAHDLLEMAWMEDQSPGRDLYRAILQVAVAYYQILRGNYNGAAKMFLRMRKWLDPLPEFCRGINIGKLRQEAHTVHQELLNLGADRISDFDPRLMKPVEYKKLN
jgi:predicted metal-dependent hydrolase